MLIIRNIFVAKPGQASKLAAQLKAAGAVAVVTHSKYRVLTDVTGDFNRVILEFEVENFAQYEERLKEYHGNTAFREKMQGYTDLWISGSREILQTA